MSVGRVINGKLAVRNGRLSCDCCDGGGGPVDPPPPPGPGCENCGALVTNYFFGCTGAGPGGRPQAQDSCTTNPLPWLRPTVTIQINQLVCRKVSGSSAPYIDFIVDDNTPITLAAADISMACSCTAFTFFKTPIECRRAAFNLPGLPGYNLIPANGFLDGGHSVFNLLNPPDAGCVNDTTRDANMLLRIGHSSSGNVFSSIFRANTANVSPCFGSSSFSGNRFSASGSPGTVEQVDYTLSGGCTSVVQNWSGQGVRDTWYAPDFEWDFDIQVTINGLTECPQDLIV